MGKERLKNFRSKFLLTVRKPRIVLLIDADNVSFTKIPPIVETLKKKGKITTSRVYGRWEEENITNWASVISEEHITPVYSSAADISLAIDAQEILLTHKDDIFVIVSSDRDFEPLVTRMHEYDKIVWYYGKNTVSTSQIEAVDKFILLDEQPAPQKTKKTADAPVKPKKAKTEAEEKEQKIQDEPVKTEEHEETVETPVETSVETKPSEIDLIRELEAEKDPEVRKAKFTQIVYEVVKSVPAGHVTTYGDIAKKLGNKNYTRVIGSIIHHNKDVNEVPCYRVVNAKGFLAENYAFGGKTGQKQFLEAEGVKVEKYQVDLTKYAAHITE